MARLGGKFASAKLLTRHSLLYHAFSTVCIWVFTRYEAVIVTDMQWTRREEGSRRQPHHLSMSRKVYPAFLFRYAPRIWWTMRELIFPRLYQYECFTTLLKTCKRTFAQNHSPTSRSRITGPTLEVRALSPRLIQRARSTATFTV